MSIFKNNIWAILLVFISLTGYTQSEKEMLNSSTTIPLKVGKNPSITLDKLVIEPINLFMQTKPIQKDSPYMQLELNVVEENRKHTTFLWGYNVSGKIKKVNYPKAYKNYSFGLKITEEEVALVIEKLNFKKAVFVDLGQTAVIGNLEIQFKECIGEWSEDINGNQTNAFNTYNLLVSQDSEQKIISFMSLNKPVEKEVSIEWKNYKILILEDSEKAVKLMVLKNDSEKE